MSWMLEVSAVVFLVLAAWLRAAGSAVAELPRADAHHDAASEVAGAATVADLLGDRSRVTPAVGMVGTALLVAAAVAGMAEVEQRQGAPLLVGALGVAAVVILLGDVVPRLLGRRHPRLVAYRSSYLLAASVRVGGWAAERLVDDNGNGNGNDDANEVDEDEKALLTSVFRFSDTIVREVMVPRRDMVTVPLGADTEELAVAAVEHGFSRFPVVDGDEVVGVFLVKDLLTGLSGESEGAAGRPPMRDAVFVPEVKQIADLLAEMRASKTHMAIVVDEFGEIAGLVTIEDLLEELVGEIADETDDDEIWVEPMGQRSWKVDARLSVENLADLLDLDLPDGDWDTVAGLVLALAERVPEEAERFDLEEATLTVARMQGRRVAEVIITDARSAVGGERS